MGKSKYKIDEIKKKLIDYLNGKYTYSQLALQGINVSYWLTRFGLNRKKLQRIMKKRNKKLQVIKKLWLTGLYTYSDISKMTNIPKGEVESLIIHYLPSKKEIMENILPDKKIRRIRL